MINKIQNMFNKSQKRVQITVIYSAIQARKAWLALLANWRKALGLLMAGLAFYCGLIAALYLGYVVGLFFVYGIFWVSGLTYGAYMTVGAYGYGFFAYQFLNA